MDAVLDWSTQGVVVGLSAAAVLRLIPRTRTRARHRFLWAAYLSLLALPVAVSILTLTRDAAGLDAGPTLAAPRLTVPAGWSSTAVLAGLWCSWFAVQAIALGRDARAVRRAKRQAEPGPRDVLTRLPHWSRVTATGRPTCVVVSNRIRAAGVLGCGAPVVAIAPRLIEELSADDLDRVLVHEWAHVQRRDDLSQLIQRLVRAVVGWHPAAWWLERQLEFEREIACDEIAVRETGSARRYAQCLVTIAAWQRRLERTLPVLAAVPRSRLERRVERIVAASSAVAIQPWRALAVSTVLAVVACALALVDVQLVTSDGPFAVANLEPASARAATITDLALRPSLEPSASVPSSTQKRKRRSSLRARLAASETGASVGAGQVQQFEEPQVIPLAKLPVQWMGGSSQSTLSARVASPSAEPAESGDVVTRTAAPRNPPGDVSAGWARAADVGVTIGRASQTAGVATAGFFKRFGKKVATSF